MKQAQRFAVVAVLASSFAAVSPSHAQTGGMDMKDMDMGKDKKAADKKSDSKTHKASAR